MRLTLKRQQAQSRRFMNPPNLTGRTGARRFYHCEERNDEATPAEAAQPRGCFARNGIKPLLNAQIIQNTFRRLTAFVDGGDH